MAEPLTPAEAMFHLGVEPIGDDDLEARDAQLADIDRLIAGARLWVEQMTGLVLTRRAVTLPLDALAAGTRLLAWPVDATVPPVVRYRDREGIDREITDARIRATLRPALLDPPAATSWPSAGLIDGPVAVTITAGFATPAEVPQDLKTAMLVMIGGMYDDRHNAGALKLAQETAARMVRSYRRWGR